MKIKQVEIQNFRCLDNVTVAFDEVTTFIGPNGVGKSSVLRALDWFFNGEKSRPLTDEDVYSGATDKKISVQVEFDQLSDKDREILGDKYAPAGVNTFTAWRIWENGTEKITGKALAFRPFEEVRASGGATEQKKRYEEVFGKYPDHHLPKWTNQATTLTAMEVWERAHPEHLEESHVSDTNFFGFAGQGKLSGLFDYVLVTADLRAGEESQDTKTTIIGRILEKTIDRTAANTAFTELAVEFSTKHEQIHGEHIAPQLVSLSNDLSKEVAVFTSGRQVNVQPTVSDYKPQTVKFLVRVLDNLTETAVDRQGHGFQRALLISALKMLATRGAKSHGDGVIYLAIEEPELFQHPTQCQAFSRVLRDLAGVSDAGLQIGYATHSPYFIEPKYFDQIRRINRSANQDGGHAKVSISHATMDQVCARLHGFDDQDAVRRRFDNACLNELSEALFAQAVVLVEGSGDRGVIEGSAAREQHLSVNGISVAECHGKNGIFLNYAIITSLGIPCYVIFDGDKDCGQRMRNNGQNEAAIAGEERKNTELNRKLLRYLGQPEVDWPDVIAGQFLTVLPDTLEPFLHSEWPEWEIARQSLIDAGRGFHEKDAATYSLAAKQATTDPAIPIKKVIAKIRQLTE